MKPSTTLFIRLVLLMFVPTLCGCSASMLNMSLGMQKKVEQETPDNPVIKIIPAWQEAEGPGVRNQAVTRGFGGQIYFITQERGLPSEVKGGIRIYLFDDQGTAEEQTKPIYQFDFTPEAWQLHSTMTNLGPAYSVFIPYTRTGRHLAQCALRIRYTPPSGPAIYSEMTTLTMPGVKKELPNAGGNPADITRVEPDGTVTIKTPENLKSNGFKNSTVMTIGAEEPAEPRSGFKPTSNIENADFQSTLDDAKFDSNLDAEIQSAKHQVQSNDRTSQKTRADDFINEIIQESNVAEPPVKTYSIPLD